jgi:hypothetical protein
MLRMRIGPLPVPALLEDSEMLFDEDGEDAEGGRVHIHQLDFLS